MRIAVIGGAGVFGARLVRLLVWDGHEVLICGRRAAPVAALATEVGGRALVLDRAGDLAPLWAAVPQAVVDAAGPFHAYGDAYRLARAAVAARVHYLDFCDDAAFCAGISALDSAARAAGVFVLSGVSSVPALSSAAVGALAHGMSEIDTIDCAILPGNRAHRGRAVVESILAPAGLPLDVVIDGQRTRARSWSCPRRYVLGPGIERVGYRIEVPDQRLFPAAFGARTVEFRAGLELAVMNRGLGALSWLRGLLGFGMARWIVGLVRLGAAGLAPFGTDVGGMVVSVTGRAEGVWVRRRWRLVARRGQGPFVPAVAARAILRAPGGVAPGARAAVGVVTLADAEAAMADLAVTCAQDASEVRPLFLAVLGAAFADLPTEVQAAHDHAGPRRFAGRASVERGQRVMARLIGWAFRFPAATGDVAVEVLKVPVPGGEDWERRFGARRFRSALRRSPTGATERFGPFTFDLGLKVKDGALHFPVTGARCLGLPLPRWSWPRSVTREYADGGQFRFDVALHAPVGGLIVRYRGWLAAGGVGR